MKEKGKTIVMGGDIEIKGSLPRHEIVRKIINTFIDTESQQRGKGAINLYLTFVIISDFRLIDNEPQAVATHPIARLKPEGKIKLAL